MYETFFRMRGRPFLASPSIDRYFPGQAIEHARQTLSRCLERSQGLGLLVGPTGAGKTLVCQLIADQLKSCFRVAYLANSRLSTRRSLFQSVLFELGLSFRDMDEGEMRLELLRSIEPSVECPQGLLLIVDEAQSLPLRLLEELRAFTNVVRNGQSRVQLVLAGGPALEERLTHPKLESFNQRIAARCYLQPLHRAETFAYVRSQLAAVYAPAEQIFTEDALEAVHRATDGVPRLINQVCDLALLLACQAGRQAIDASVVEAAWAELQQLPAPWQSSELELSPATQATSEGGGATSVIEFGELSDEPWSDLDSSPVVPPAARMESAAPLSPPPPTLQAPTLPPPTLQAPTLQAPPTSMDEPLAAFAATTPCSLDCSPIYPASEPVFVDSSLPLPSLRQASAPQPKSQQPGTQTSNAAASSPSTLPSASTSMGPELSPLDRLFGSDFDEEEAVVDRFSPRSFPAIESRIRVSCVEGREIASLLANPAPSSPRDPRAEAVSRTVASSGRNGTTLDARVESRHEIPTSNDPEGQSAVDSAEERLLKAIRSLPPVDDPRRWPSGGVSVLGAVAIAGECLVDAETDVPAPTKQATIHRMNPAATANPVLAANPGSTASPISAVNLDSTVSQASAVSHVPVVNHGPRPHLPTLPVDDRDLLVVQEEGQSVAKQASAPEGRAERRDYRQLFSRLRRG